MRSCSDLWIYKGVGAICLSPRDGQWYNLEPVGMGGFCGMVGSHVPNQQAVKSWQCLQAGGASPPIHL